MTDGRKLVVVLGATGAQGYPIVKYLSYFLSQSWHTFRVRAVTRDSTKPIALELSSLGAEVVQADFDHEDTIASALEGAHAVFCITNFWDKADYDLEVKQGKLINKLASRLPHLETFIFSSLPDARKIDKGQFQNNLPYNAKTDIKEDLKTYPKLWKKTVELGVAAYFQNWLKYTAVFGPVKDENGTFILSMPYPAETRIPVVWADDVAPVVDAILKAGDKYHGKTVGLFFGSLPQDNMLAVWAKNLGVKAVFKQVTPQEYFERMKSAGFPDHLAKAATELSQGLVFGEEGMTSKAASYVQGRDLILPNYKMKTWEEYVKEEDWSSFS